MGGGEGSAQAVGGTLRAYRCLGLHQNSLRDGPGNDNGDWRVGEMKAEHCADGNGRCGSRGGM